MPRRLNRPNYGWSYSLGKGQRTPSDQYKKNFDLIKFNKHNPDEWKTKKVHRGGISGIAIVKRF